MELRPKSMLVTETFVFKASASAWPKGKRLGSRSRLTSVRRHEIQMRHNSQFPTLSFQRTNATGSRIQGKCRLRRCILRQYHANTPVESIPRHTTQNEFKSKRNSPTSLTVNQIRNLDMRRMSMRQTTKPFNNLATKTPWAATWNPGTQKALHSLIADGIVSQADACHGSVRLQKFSQRLAEGKRHGSRSNLTSARPHEIQMRHNSQFPTLSFQRTNPTGFRANVFDTEMHFQPISCQYPSRKHTRHTTSYHTEWVQVKMKFTHFTDSQPDLESGNAKDEHEQTTKPFNKLATKTPWAATWNPWTQKAFTPSSPMELPHNFDACHGNVRLQSFS